jgi:hypothetical protein
MPGNPRQIYRDAERRFPVRVRIAVPKGGFGRQFAVMHDWLDAVCGAGGWSSAPAGLIGVLNGPGPSLCQPLLLRLYHR